MNIGVSIALLFILVNVQFEHDIVLQQQEKELAHTRAYLQLEQQRFGGKLKVVYEIGTVDFFIPPLTPQPISENAVRHGLMKKENGGTLTIRSCEEDNTFFIVVSDDGVDASAQQLRAESGTHIGIANVRNRL